VTYVEEVLKASQSGAFDWTLKDVADLNTNDENIIEDGKARALAYILSGRDSYAAESVATDAKYTDWSSKGAGYKERYGAFSRKKN